jgi:hypothetical protein
MGEKVIDDTTIGAAAATRAPEWFGHCSDGAGRALEGKVKNS